MAYLYIDIIHIAQLSSSSSSSPQGIWNRRKLYSLKNKGYIETKRYETIRYDTIRCGVDWNGLYSTCIWASNHILLSVVWNFISICCRELYQIYIVRIYKWSVCIHD